MTPTTRRVRRAGVAAMAVLLLAAGPAHAAEVWWFDALKIEKAHEVTKGEGATVLVFDTEIDPTVPELRGADLEWSTQCEASENLGTPLKKYSPTSAATSKDANHGTAMTALIAGQGNGGVVGMAPEASVFFVAGAPGPEQLDVCPRPVADLAVEHDADIVSHAGNYLTNGGDVRQLLRENIVLVAAAGNGEPYLDEPASRPGVVAVGAADHLGYPWFDNSTPLEDTDGQTGGSLTVLAPGVDVPAGAGGGGVWAPAEPRTGTSAATSIVSGALALVKSAYPDATGNQLIQHLIHHTGEDEFEYLPESGFGIVSVTKMLANDPTGWPDINPLLDSPEDIVAKYPSSIHGKYPRATELPGDEAAEPSTDDTDTSPASKDSSDGAVPWPLVVTLLALVLILAAAFLWIRRSRSSRATKESLHDQSR